MKRNKFSLSRYRLQSGNMGYLLPCNSPVEVLPGDTVQMSTSMLLRTTPMVYPTMHPTHVKIHHWFVPHRLVWDEWEDFITGVSEPEFPYLGTGGPGFTAKELMDYYGVPPGINYGTGNISALPARGYAKIFNEWYRDQDLVSELALSIASGSDATTNRSLARVSWDKDYFTTARPWPQKGGDVTIPVDKLTGINTPGQIRYAANDALAASGDIISGSGVVQVDGTPSYYDPNGTLVVNPDDLRTAMALQRYEEARARYGSRYTEYIRYAFQTKSSDARLQRPEYLGGGKQTIQFSEVMQTAPDITATTNEGVGNLTGHGIGAARSNRFRRFFEEHGYIHSFVVVQPKGIYTNGIDKHWIKKTKEDFFQKELQYIGQQEIDSMEINGAPTSTVFGYQDRYDDYRRGRSSIAGEFRSSLDDWHMGRTFSSTPTLNASFINCEPTDRIWQVAPTTADTLRMMFNHSIQARRVVTANATPKLF